jgi:hypothetical protein
MQLNAAYTLHLHINDQAVGVVWIRAQEFFR